MSRRLRKFKMSRSTGGIEVIYESENGATGTFDEYTLKTYESPVSALDVALQNLTDHVIAICELPHTMKDEIIVSGVSISYTDDIQGLVITSMRSLKGSSAPMLINTPHFSAQPYGEGSDSEISVFTLECGEALQKLEARVFEFIDGDRLQMSLLASAGAGAKA